MLRRPRSDSLQAQLTDLERSVTERYPVWPREEVTLPASKALRRRALRWYDQFCRHRIPEGWAPGDPGRLALLARTWAFWEYESYLFAERGGDDTKLARLQSTIGLLSRQLGLNVSPIDGRQAAAFAGSRARAAEVIADLDDDGLLARPAPAH